MEESVTFVLSNGQKFGGTYCHELGKLSGLNNICYIGGNDGLRSIHMLLFAFHTKSIVTISAFDEACYEIIFPGTPLSKGNVSFINKHLFSKHQTNVTVVFIL